MSRKREFSADELALINGMELKGVSFGQEREFMENIFVGRLNFFLVVYALFMTAGVTANLGSGRFVVFYVGAFILMLFWVSIYRAYGKLDIILRIAFEIAKDHPAYVIEELYKNRGKWVGLSNSKLMAIWIPFVCILTLFFGGLAFQLCWLK